MSKEPEPRAPQGPARRVVDWHQAAELLDQGMTVAQAAARLGCSRSALARRCRADPAFQSCIAPDTDTPTPDPRPTIENMIGHEVSLGNVRVTLWLAGRLKLVTPPNEQTPDQELRKLLSGLTTEELREFESLRDEP